jgi:hypothetical protein
VLPTLQQLPHPLAADSERPGYLCLAQTMFLKGKSCLLSGGLLMHWIKVDPIEP